MKRGCFNNNVVKRALQTRAQIRRYPKLCSTSVQMSVKIVQRLAGKSYVRENIFLKISLTETSETFGTLLKKLFVNETCAW